VLLTAYPELQAQFDLEALDIRRFEPGALVWDGSTLSTLGDPLRRPGTLWSTVTSPVGSIPDKLRVLRQRVRLGRAAAPELLRQDDISTIDALHEDGFSDAMIEGFFRPLVGGIQLDPSLQTSRRMFDVILRSLITGDVGVPARGMGALSEQLAGRLPDGSIQLGARVVSVARGEVVVDGQGPVAARSIVVATDGPSAVDLVALPPVESNHATCVWFAAAQPPTAERYIVLDPTGTGPASNIAVMTNVAPDYSPDGSAVIAAACPGVLDPAAEPAGRPVATPPHRCDPARPAAAAPTVPPEAAGGVGRRPVRLRRSPRHGVDPRRAVLRAAVRRRRARRVDLTTPRAPNPGDRDTSHLPARPDSGR
jgi:phytoene dehydrogenase-like protein